MKKCLKYTAAGLLGAFVTLLMMGASASAAMGDPEPTSSSVPSSTETTSSSSTSTTAPPTSETSVPPSSTETTLPTTETTVGETTTSLDSTSTTLDGVPVPAPWDTDYVDCTAARLDYPSDVINVDHVAYSESLDWDGDGIACEPDATSTTVQQIGSAQELPRTGSTIGPLILFGIGMVVLGFSLLRMRGRPLT